MPEHTHTLLATLGGQPQVITFTLDLLLRGGYRIREVIVISPNPSGSRLKASLDRLHREFIGDQYRIDGCSLPCHFRHRVLEIDDTPLDDISDITGLKGTHETIHRLIQELKQQPRHLHLSVTGGRRLMSFFAISAAQSNFDPFDHIWHIYTPDPIKDQVKDGKLMHLPPGSGVCLIEIPLLALSNFLPPPPQQSNTAQEVYDSQKAQMKTLERKCCAYVVRKATPSQRKVLQAFAHGLRPQEVANQLDRSPKTIDSHKSILLQLCKEAWDLPSGQQLTYHFFRRFADYFELDK